MCLIDAEVHSQDTVEVYAGHITPAVACGFHARHAFVKVLAAHDRQVASIRERVVDRLMFSGLSTPQIMDAADLCERAGCADDTTIEAAVALI